MATDRVWSKLMPIRERLSVVIYLYKEIGCNSVYVNPDGTPELVYGEGIWKVGWSAYVFPDFSEVGRARWDKAKIAGRQPSSCCSDTSFVAIKFHTETYRSEKTDTIKIASGSRRLIVDFCAFVVDVYKNLGAGLDHDLEAVTESFTHGGYVYEPPRNDDHSNSMSETVNPLTVPLLENSDEDHDSDSSVNTVVD